MSPPHAPLSSSKEQKGDLSSSVCFEVETRYVQQFIAPHLSWELAVLFLSATNCKCNICLWISNANFFFIEHSLLFLERLKTVSWLISRIVTYFYHSFTNILFSFFYGLILFCVGAIHAQLLTSHSGIILLFPQLAVIMAFSRLYA